MFNDLIHPHSSVSARDLLKQTIKNDSRFETTPTIDKALSLSSSLQAEGKGYVNPTYLLEVWTECTEK